MAATQDKTRFSRINGYGSNAPAASRTFTTIHRIRTPLKEKINAQLPANFAMESAARCPSVYFSFPLSGCTETLLSASRSNTSSSVISWRISFRTSFNSFLFSFMIATPLSNPSLRYAKVSAGFLNSERLFFTTRLTKRMISSLLYRS